MSQEFKSIDSIGHIRRINVHGVDALGEVLAMEIELGQKDAKEGVYIGTFTVSIEELQSFFRQAVDALAEAESRPILRA